MSQSTLIFIPPWFQCFSIPWDPSQANNISQVALLVFCIDCDKQSNSSILQSCYIFGFTTIEVAGQPFKILICLRSTCNFFFNIFKVRMNYTSFATVSENFLSNCLCHLFTDLCHKELFLCMCLTFVCRVHITLHPALYVGSVCLCVLVVVVQRRGMYCYIKKCWLS